jgi:hypothetical protein
MTMTRTRILMLAALATLPLGIGTAMADGESGGPDYWSRPTIDAAIKAASNYNPARAQVQFGSSDVGATEKGSAHTATFIFNHHLYGAAGVSG